VTKGPEARGEIPEPHAAFLNPALERLQRDPRLVGVAAGGSYLAGSLDEFSDLDLLIAVEPDAYESVSGERAQIAADLGPLLAAFTGEHVGEPRLLICLYGPPLLHVDLKFIRLEAAAVRVEDAAVLWERDGRLSEAMRQAPARYPLPNLQWIEDRFWIWIHYGAAKVGRGELFEAIDFLGFLRSRVLGPLSLLARGARPDGVRRVEFLAPDLAEAMRSTVAQYDAASCASSLRAAARLYGRLRSDLASQDLRVNALAQAAALAYLGQIEGRFGSAAATGDPS
jgi:predicted nucleotidyltransferase